MVLKPDIDATKARADAVQVEAATWQISERPFTIKIIKSGGVTRLLSCNEGFTCDAGSYPPGFEIALFGEPGPLSECQGAPDCTPSALVKREAEGAQQNRAKVVEELLAKLPSEKRAASRPIVEMIVDTRIKQALALDQQQPGETAADWVKRLSDPDLQEPGKSPKADAATRYIGWLTQNHPDFIRLNDFHHALAITRWLARANVSVKPPGPLYAPRPYPIPNRIRGGDPGHPLEAFVAE